MPTTMQQLLHLQRRYPTAPTVTFSGSDLARDPEGAIHRLCRRCEAEFQPGDTWILATDPGNVTVQASIKVAGAIAKVVARVVTERHVDTLVLTGGSTAFHIAGALDVGSIGLIGEIRAGIAFGRCRSRSVDREMNLVTKGGGFGEPDAFVSAMEFLRNQGVQQR